MARPERARVAKLDERVGSSIFSSSAQGCLPSRKRQWFPAALLAWLLSGVAALGQSSTAARLPTLTHVEQIRRMSIEEAKRGYPVRLRAVVTYYNWSAEDLFIQDSTAGIWVSPGQTKLALHPGELVEVEGISGVGDLAPAIDRAHFRNLGEGPLPEPRRPTSDELASGRPDSQWIELRGVVRSAAERDGGLVLNVSSGAFECRVFVLKYPSLPTDIVDGQVRVQGVFAGLYDPNSVRVIGFQVLTPSWSDVEVVARPAQQLWSAPVRPTSLFLRLTPGGAFTQRVRVRGVVTLQQPGQFLYIRDSEGALLVNTTQSTPLKVGDLIDALGYPALGDYTVIMRDAIFQRVAVGPAPEPVLVSPEQLRAGNHNADLVRLSARLLNSTARPGEQVLELQAGQVNFRATLNTGTNLSPLGSLRLGSLLQLTGVTMVETDKNHEPKGFEILLRSPADVVVLELPSWWTAQRISWLLVMLAAILFWISFWAAALRRRVEERTETIRATLESTVDGILVVNSAGKIVAYNRKFTEMWGIPRSILASRDHNVVLDFVLPQVRDPEAFLTRVRQTYAAADDAQTDDVIEFKDGRVFERHSEPQRIMGRNVGRVWGFRNVTERKRTEEELHRSRQMLRLVLDNIPQRVFWKDRNFNYLGCNMACAVDAGLRSPEEIVGKNDFELSWRETAELYRADDTQVMEQGSPKLSFEEPQEKPDGSSMWLRTSKLPLRDQEGKVIGVIGTYEDITERKRAEEALRESEARYRGLFENSLEGIGVSKGNAVIDANRALLDIFGYGDLGEFTAIPLLEHVAPQSRGLIKEIQEKRGRGDPRPKRLEYQITRKDGQTRTLEVSTDAIYFGGERYTQSTFRDVTERKQAEEALRESEARFRAVFENAAIGVTLVDMHGHPVESNLAFQKMLGYSARELAQMAFAEFTHPDDAQASREPFADLWQGKRDRYQLEKRYCRKDGQIVWGQLTVSLVRNQSGGPLYAIGMIEDISERKRAEEALLESKALLNSIVNSTSDLIWSVNAQSLLLLSFNQGFVDFFLQRFGILVKEGMRPEDVLPTEDLAQQWYEFYQRALREGPYTIEYDMKTAPKTLQLSFNVLSRADVVFAVSVFAKDVTERKRTEEALRASEERLRSFIENVPLGVYRTTPDGRVLMANPGLLRMLGYDSLQELVSRNLELDGFEAGYPRSAFREQLERQGEVRGLEATWKRRDGSVIFVRESARVVRAEDGRVLYYDGTIEDVTERRRLEEQLRQAQKMEAVGRLAAGVAHDFNNLLTIVIGYSDLTLQRVAAGSRMRSPLEEIKKAGERAAWLTRQLLAFSRKQVLQPQILDLNTLLANVEKMLRRVIGEDIELVLHLPHGLGRVKADPGQIEQVIMNLAVNARDAMPQGGRLTLEAANVELDSDYVGSHQSVLTGAYVMFAMSDTGIGMDAKTQARVFEPFFTTKEPGKGTGLGLSTVYGIIKQSGGYIWVYSEPGKGATFKVYLPRIDQPEDPMALGEPSGAELPLASETILLVEDEKAVRSLAREVLECKGYHVLETAGAMEALEVGERHKEHIHLLLTDVVMPQMGGRELAQHLAQLHPETKVLFMSGYADNAVVHHGLLDPGTTLLQKPFTAQALARKLREVLDGGGDHKAGLATGPSARGTSEVSPTKE